MMKVYVVFSSYLEIDVIEKVFANEEKAREFVRDKNFNSMSEWTYCEMEVE